DGYAELLRPAASPNASSLNPVDGVQHIVNFDGAVRVKVKKISLPTLMGEYGIDKVSLLKMDCEGCEYEVIRTTPTNILERIDSIILEYHDGPKDLPSLLSRAGFTVDSSYTEPLGLLRAWRGHQ
ncbi:MAG: FkbM family methyltransferase, partial [Thermoprotei archaeon]